MPSITRAVSGFKGLNNVGDPLFLGLRWLTRAENVNVTEDGAIVRRDGFSSAYAGALSGAFTTFDYKRLYVVDAGALKRVYPDMTTKTIVAGLSNKPMHWAEVNDSVYYSNGADKGVISPGDEYRPWGSMPPDAPNVSAVSGNLPAGTYQVCCTFVLAGGTETGASDATTVTLTDGQSLQITGIAQRAGARTLVYIAPADSTVFQLAYATTRTAESWNQPPESLGNELTNQFLDAPPSAAVIPAFWNGRMYLMQYMPSSDQTVIWFSEPLGYHLFNLNTNFMLVPGEGVLLAPTPTALIIGTKTRIVAVDMAGNMGVLADYGCVPGYGWAHDVDDNMNIVFWTKRGVCSAMPFVNLTLRQISVAPGNFAGVAIIKKDGRKRFVAALQQGGTPFNRRG